jgi:muramoyltetrapeptide carboxypeptidase
LKTIIPPYLQKGDTIAIAATARSVDPEKIEEAVKYIQSKGFNVYLDPELFKVNRQFAGNDEERAHLFNDLLADNQVKAIWCARGGYGTARMVDKIDFSLLKSNPKWIAGFSDVTVLLNQIYTVCNMASMHSTMPVFMHHKSDQDYQDVSIAIDSLLQGLMGNFPRFDLQNNPSLNSKSVEGIGIGGNLSVLYSILGSVSDVDWSDKILFIEDLDEYYYHIDRMILGLKRAGKFEKIKALFVGSFISMNDHSIPFGYDVKEILTQHCSEYGFPIVFDVNFGHHLQNIVIPFGLTTQFNNGILTFVAP